jgi:xanthine dehydrogenase accessory factor
VAAIVAPAGYPIAASTPEEIALSVLAAVVAQRRGAQPSAPLPAPASCCGSAALAPQPIPAGVAEETSRGSCCGG